MGMHPNPANLREVQYYPRYSEVCPNCYQLTFERKDWKHGIMFCEKCGFVSKETLIVSRQDIKDIDEFIVEKYPKYNKPHTINITNDITRLRNIYEKQTNCKKQYRIERDYKHYLDIVASYFKMTQSQKKEVMHLIIKGGGVNDYCKNCTYEEIIIGLCITFMRLDGRRIRFKEYKLIKEVNLTEQKYTIILQNILKTMRQ